MKCCIEKCYFFFISWMCVWLLRRAINVCLSSCVATSSTVYSQHHCVWFRLNCFIADRREVRTCAPHKDIGYVWYTEDDEPDPHWSCQSCQKFQQVKLIRMLRGARKCYVRTKGIVRNAHALQRLFASSLHSAVNMDNEVAACSSAAAADAVRSVLYKN